MIKKVKNTVQWTYVISDRNGNKIVVTFNKKKKKKKKELEKTNQTEFRVEKLIKKKVDKLNVKWKDYDNSFNTCIDKIYEYMYI